MSGFHAIEVVCVGIARLLDHAFDPSDFNEDFDFVVVDGSDFAYGLPSGAGMIRDGLVVWAGPEPASPVTTVRVSSSSVHRCLSLPTVRASEHGPVDNHSGRRRWLFRPEPLGAP